jgi:hypothetical protein
MGCRFTSIGGYAFQWLTNLTSVAIPDSITNFEDGSLYKGGGAGTFLFCTGLTNVAMGKGVMHMGIGAFQWCTGIATVAIPERVTSIGDFAFNNCSGLIKVTIGKSVTNIGTNFGYAFSNCTNLVAVYFQGDEPFASPSSFLDDNLATLYYLPGTTGWGPTVEGRPAVLWNPTVRTNDASFGVRQNRFGFNITGTPDIPIVVEATTNLVAPSWVPSQSGTLTNGVIYFCDSLWTNYLRRFYRIRSP